MSALAAARFVPEFNSTKQPIEVHLDELRANLTSQHPSLIRSMSALSTGFIYT